MTWWKRDKQSIELPADDAERHVKTEGLWIKCEGCGQIIWRKTLEEGLQVCRKCGYHFRISAVERLKMLFDDGLYEEFDARMVSTDPLAFHDSKPYKVRLAAMREATSLPDAIVSAGGLLNGRRVYMCAMELQFIGGSMGAVVGEKITRAIERSIAHKAPLIIFSASGGARMQEGAVSLMQLAKISAALMRLDEARVCHAGGFEHRGTWGLDWFRRPPRDRADDSSKAAGGLPDGGVPATAWIPGCRCETHGYEGIPFEGADVFLGLVCLACQNERRCSAFFRPVSR
jgi:acetyl-CoA carboxylase carboxyl transferase beta subunit